MEVREAYEARVRAELAKWRAETDKLEARARKASILARIGYLQEVGNLRRKQEEAERRLQELMQSGGDVWQDKKAGLDQASTDLERAVTNAASRF